MPGLARRSSFSLMAYSPTGIIFFAVSKGMRSMPKTSASDVPFSVLHEFLHCQRDSILEELGHSAVKTLISARKLSSEDLRNNLPELLNAIAEQADKSSGTSWKVGS